MTGTNCDLFTHNQSRSYLNHLVQCTYHVTMRRVCESLLKQTSNKHYIFVCVCARSCVRVCVCACECPGSYASACVRVASLIQHATRMRHIVTSFVASGSTIFFDIISQTARISEKKLLNIKCVLIFCTAFI